MMPGGFMNSETIQPGLFRAVGVQKMYVHENLVLAAFAREYKWQLKPDYICSYVEAHSGNCKQ